VLVLDASEHPGVSRFRIIHRGETKLLRHHIVFFIDAVHGFQNADLRIKLQIILHLLHLCPSYRGDFHQAVLKTWQIGLLLLATLLLVEDVRRLQSQLPLRPLLEATAHILHLADLLIHIFERIFARCFIPALMALVSRNLADDPICTLLLARRQQTWNSPDRVRVLLPEVEVALIP
jgi:hypothetical protein